MLIEVMHLGHFSGRSEKMVCNEFSQINRAM